MERLNEEAGESRERTRERRGRKGKRGKEGMVVGGGDGDGGVV